MIITKVRQLIDEFRTRDKMILEQNQMILEQNKQILDQCKELEWAHIFHDTIKGRDWLENLALNPSGWAVNFSFLYLLTKILADYKPKKIIEFGLGESSKLISTFLENELRETTHLIIEQSEEWIQEFNSRFLLTPNSTVLHFPLEIKDIKGYPVKTYASLHNKINDTFDLYVIDGPHGSERNSRYDICYLAEKLKHDDEFIIIIDDLGRIGEQDTANILKEMLTSNGIKIFSNIYTGNKSQIIITTKKYQYAASM